MSKVLAASRSRLPVKRVLAARVVRRERLSPSFARVTIAGPALANLEAHGFDQWFRMFIPKADVELKQPLPETIADERWYTQFLGTPEDERPWMRYVTIRDHRYPQTTECEIDVDVVVHGAPGSRCAGPLSTWGQTAALGSPVALLDQGALFKPALAGVKPQEPTGEAAGNLLRTVEGSALPSGESGESGERHPSGLVIIGDETAVPGIAGTLRSLPADAKGHAFLEVPEPADCRTLSAPDGVAVSWYTRHGVSAAPGSLALAAAKPLLDERGGEYVYAAGESKMIAELNALLRVELQWPKELITAVGYWHRAV